MRAVKKRNEQRQQYKKVVEKRKVTDTEIYEEHVENQQGKLMTKRPSTSVVRRWKNAKRVV